MTILSEAERNTGLASLPDWTYDPERNGIARSFRFPDFSFAIAFMFKAALIAEKANHHPHWTNMYDRVDVLLSTHSAGGVTDKDLAMAEEMDRLAVELAQPGPRH